MVVSMFDQPNKSGKPPGAFRFFMIGMGIFITLSFLLDAGRSFFTWYAITNKRLLIVRKLFWSSEVESYYNQDIDFVMKTKWKNGSGNIVFKRIREKSGKGYSNTDIGFFGIKDVEQVERLITRVFREPKH